MSTPPDPFEFVKNLWGPMGLPMAGLGGTATAMTELDKRIAELKSVETWLNMNLNVLRMTLQGLEMPKAGLAAVQSAAAAAAPPAPAQPGGEAPAKK